MKLWQKLLAFFAAVIALVLYIGKVLLVKDQISHEDFPQNEKLRLEKLKQDLEEKSAAVDKKEYSDDEIRDKFNS